MWPSQPSPLQDCAPGGAAATQACGPLGVSRFGTDSLRPAERFEAWAARFARCCSALPLDATDPHNFKQSTAAVTLGQLRCVHTCGSPIGGHRATLGGAADDGEVDYPVVLLAQRGPGSAAFTTGERNVIVSQGRMTLIDPRAELRFASGATANLLVVELHRSVAERWQIGAEACRALPLLAGERGWSAFLSAFVHSIDIDNLGAITSPIEAGAVADHLGSMLSYALAEIAQSPEPARASASDLASRGLHARMVEWLRVHHTSSDIDAERVARAFNVSVRYVHLVFARNGPGQTFLKTLQSLRLETALRLMESTSGPHLTLSGIAFRSGMSSADNLRRLIGKRMGALPRRLR